MQGYSFSAFEGFASLGIVVTPFLVCDMVQVLKAIITEVNLHLSFGV
jgi:hypothetical protein